MQAGDKVMVVEGEEERRGTVVEITGTGNSLYKRLTAFRDDSESGDRVYDDLPHENDAEEGETHWREIGAARREVQTFPAAVPGGGVPSGAASVPILPDPTKDITTPTPKKSGKKS